MKEKNEKIHIRINTTINEPCIADDDFATKLVGTYESEIWSNGLSKGLTTFSIDSNKVISGVYTFQGDSDIEEKRSLGNCLKKFNVITLQKNELTCIWRDGYGEGTLTVSFSNDFSSFEGAWGEGNSSVEFTWNGKRIN